MAKFNKIVLLALLTACSGQNLEDTAIIKELENDMSRDGNGNYTLPAGNPVVPNTVIETGWANPTMSDVGSEMTDSLSRSGKGGMQSQLKCIDGTEGAPGICFLNQISMGFYRDSAGDMRATVAGTDSMRWTSSAVQLWDGANWNDVLTGGSSSSFVGLNPNLIDTTTPALITGDADPDTGQHIEYGTSIIQSKSDATTPATLSLNTLGGNVFIGDISNLGYTTSLALFNGGGTSWRATIDEMSLNKSDNSDTTEMWFNLRNNNGTDLGRIGVAGDSTDDLHITSEQVGSSIRLNPENGVVKFGANAQRLNPPTVERVESGANYQLVAGDQNSYIYRTGGAVTVEILAGLTSDLGGPDQEFWIAYPSSETDTLNFTGVVPLDNQTMFPGDVSILKHLGSNTYQLIPVVETQNSNTIPITATGNFLTSMLGQYLYRDGPGNFNLTVTSGLNTGRQQKAEIVIDNINDIDSGTITIIQGASTNIRLKSGGTLTLDPGETGYLKAISTDVWLFHK